MIIEENLHFWDSAFWADPFVMASPDFEKNEFFRKNSFWLTKVTSKYQMNYVESFDQNVRFTYSPFQKDILPQIDCKFLKIMLRNSFFTLEEFQGKAQL